MSSKSNLPCDEEARKPAKSRLPKRGEVEEDRLGEAAVIVLEDEGE